jgi:hypothetical protein
LVEYSGGRREVRPDQPALRPSPQYLDVQEQRRSEPQRKPRVIRDTVVGERVHENIEPLAVQHQPRYQTGKILNREGHLIHRYRMRPDRFVVPAPDPSPREILADAGPQARRGRPGLLRA